MGPANNPQSSTNNQKNVGQIFTPVCFKCGTGSHFLPNCRVKIEPCTFPSCNFSSSHSAAGHQAMLDKGKTVVPDRPVSAVTGKPVAPASSDTTGAPTAPLSDAQLIASAKKAHEKKADKAKKRKRRGNG